MWHDNVSYWLVFYYVWATLKYDTTIGMRLTDRLLFIIPVKYISYVLRIYHASHLTIPPFYIAFVYLACERVLCTHLIVICKILLLMILDKPNKQMLAFSLFFRTFFLCYTLKDLQTFPLVLLMYLRLYLFGWLKLEFPLQ